MTQAAKLLEGHTRACLQAELANGRSPASALLSVRSAVVGAVQDFILKHDIPGVRYWYHPGSDSHFATEPSEHLWFLEIEDVDEISREQYLEAQEL